MDNFQVQYKIQTQIVYQKHESISSKESNRYTIQKETNFEPKFDLKFELDSENELELQNASFDTTLERKQNKKPSKFVRSSTKSRAAQKPIRFLTI